MDKNPLDCNICRKELVNPVVLTCLHTVCKDCLTAKCSICPASELGNIRVDEEEEYREDPIATFLLKTSHEEVEKCANCEQIVHPMFYCETCRQSLCQECKLITHKARMFEKHKILKSEERLMVYSNGTCNEHNEPLILYHGVQKTLACIQCFNIAQSEDKLLFVSIDTAYKNSIELVERHAITLKKYQDNQQEELRIRQRILQESSKTYETEKKDLYHICQLMVDAVHSTRDLFLANLDRERAAAESACLTQISTINTYLDPIRLSLMASRIMCASASKLDVLQLIQVLSGRVERICSRCIDKVPTWRNSNACIEFRSEVAKALEPHIGLSAAFCPISAVKEGSKEGTGNSYKTLSGSQSLCKPQVLPKFQALIDLSGAFGHLLNRIEGPLCDIAVELTSLSTRVQEMQRDITMRRCLVKPDSINILAKECQSLEAKLSLHTNLIEELQPEMQEIWQEQLDRIRRQQIIFREKVNECSNLRCIVRDVLNASKQLGPFAVCIEQMSALIDPRRCHPPDPAPMESICLQISTIEPDSEGRIAAIEKEEQNRRAVLEAKKKAEEADRGSVVKGLKHGKTKKREHSRFLVNTNRERSPGGTDSALLSPFTRRPIISNLRDDCGSDCEETFTDECFDLWANDSCSEAGFSFTDQARCSSSLSLVIPSRTNSPDNPIVVKPACVVINENKSSGFLAAVEEESSRMVMIQSLHDLFASQKVSDDEKDCSVLASAVKSSQKVKKIDNGSKDKIIKETITLLEVKEKCLNETNNAGDSAYPKVMKRSRKTRKSSEDISMNETKYISTQSVSSSSDQTKVPVVPFVPNSIFEFEDSGKLSGFEAKEKMLQSLKERVRSRANSDLERE